MTTASTFDTTLSGLGIARTGAIATANVSAAGATQTLGQGDFLKLMTAQLKNQDPFNPVDNTQMVAQMAQFSSVAGIAQMNTTLNGIAGKLGVTSTSDAMAYVGKTVLTAATPPIRVLPAASPARSSWRTTPPTSTLPSPTRAATCSRPCR